MISCKYCPHLSIIRGHMFGCRKTKGKCYCEFPGIHLHLENVEKRTFSNFISLATSKVTAFHKSGYDPDIKTSPKWCPRKELKP